MFLLTNVLYLIQAPLIFIIIYEHAHRIRYAFFTLIFISQLTLLMMNLKIPNYLKVNVARLRVSDTICKYHVYLFIFLKLRYKSQ